MVTETRRDKEKQEVRRTNARDWARRQESGGGPAAIRLPPGVEMYKLEPGNHDVDFMEFIAAHKNPNADDGVLHFERKYGAHDLPGPDGRVRRQCCLWETWGRPCPACKRVNGGQMDVIFRSKQRHLWLINDRPGDPDNPPKIFDAGWYNRGMGFGEMMKDEIDSNEAGMGFASVDGGMTVRLTVKELQGKGFKYNGVTKITFIPRKKQYPTSHMKKMPCLDECLVPVMPADLRANLSHHPVWEFTDADWKRCQREMERMMDGEDAISHEEVVASKVDDEDNVGPGEETAVGVSDRNGTDRRRSGGQAVAEEAVVDRAGEEEIKVGSVVAFEYKGRARTGKVKSVNRLEETAEVDIGTKVVVVDLEELTLDEEDEEVGRASNPASRQRVPAPSVNVNDDDEDDEDDEDEGDDDDDED